MQGEFQNGFKCADFDALLTEAIDGTLTGTQSMRFEAHRGVLCPVQRAVR